MGDRVAFRFLAPASGAQNGHVHGESMEKKNIYIPVPAFSDHPWAAMGGSGAVHITNTGETNLRQNSRLEGACFALTYLGHLETKTTALKAIREPETPVQMVHRHQPHQFPL